jgi:hypothetical protein
MAQTFYLYIFVSPRTMVQAITPLIPSSCTAVEGVAQSLSVSLAMEPFLFVEGFIKNGPGLLDKMGLTPPTDDELKAARAARKKGYSDPIRVCSWNPVHPKLAHRVMQIL